MQTQQIDALPQAQDSFPLQPGLSARAVFEEFLANEADEVLRSVERMLRRQRHTSHEVEEIIQETHLAAIMEIERSGIRSLHAFYLSVASRRGITRRRRAARFRKRFGRQLPLEPHHALVDPRDGFERQELRDTAREATRNVPFRVRSVFELFRAGFSHAEISTLEGISVRTSQRRLREAVRCLRLRLQD